MKTVHYDFRDKIVIRNIECPNPNMIQCEHIGSIC